MSLIVPPLKNIFIQLPCQAEITTSTDLWQSQEKKKSTSSPLLCVRKEFQDGCEEHLHVFNSRKRCVCEEGPLPKDCTLETWCLKQQIKHTGTEGGQMVAVAHRPADRRRGKRGMQREQGDNSTLKHPQAPTLHLSNTGV